jgi:DNA-binding MarR family transcriptional regulator
VSQESSRNGSARCDMSNPFECPRGRRRVRRTGGLPSSYARLDKAGNTFLETWSYTARLMAEWSFLTNHARVLVCIAHDPGVRLRDLAAAVGITERRAYGIVTDLTAAGYVVKSRDGRRNRYQVQSYLPLREASTRDRTIGDVLDVLIESELPIGEHASPR